MIATFAYGWSGLALSYAAVQAPMIAGLLRGRARFRDFLASPLIALPMTAIAGAGVAVASPLFAPLGAAPAGAVQFGLSAAAGAAMGYLGGLATARGDAPSKIYQRGSVVKGPEWSTPASRSRARGGDATRDRCVMLAGLALPLEDETKHFKLIGTTGTGKSTAIKELLETALARGDRAVIADPDAGYLDRFYDPARGDLILNPFDRRSVKWDLFGEIENAYDIDQLSRSLIPDEDASDRSWRSYARTFFGAVTRQAHEGGIRDVAELYRLLVVADAGELRTLVKGTPAQPFLEEHNGRMFDSIRSVTSSAVAGLDYIGQQDAPGLSIRQWVKRDSNGVLFIPYQAGQIAALRSPISAWMRLAIFETMNRDVSAHAPLGGDPAARQAQSRESRLWFVVDELDALGQIDGLKDALARLRKFGGRCVLGFQSIAQVSSTYGQGDAHTIVENCGNTLILRCSASEGGGTARFASQLIGDREVLRTTESRSRRFSELTGTVSRSQHFSTEPAVLPSQIEQLPDLAGYLKHASDPAWHRVRLHTARRANDHRDAAQPEQAGLTGSNRSTAAQGGRDRGRDGAAHE